jgi:hypothetical protein
MEKKKRNLQVGPPAFLPSQSVVPLDWTIINSRSRAPKSAAGPIFPLKNGGHVSSSLSSHKPNLIRNEMEYILQKWSQEYGPKVGYKNSVLKERDVLRSVIVGCILFISVLV